MSLFLRRTQDTLISLLRKTFFPPKISTCWWSRSHKFLWAGDVYFKRSAWPAFAEASLVFGTFGLNEGKSCNRSAAWFLFWEVSCSDLHMLPWPALKLFCCHGNTCCVREGCAYLKGRMLLSTYGGAQASTSPHKLQKARERACSLEFSILN